MILEFCILNSDWYFDLFILLEELTLILKWFPVAIIHSTQPKLPSTESLSLELFMNYHD